MKRIIVLSLVVALCMVGVASARPAKRQQKLLRTAAVTRVEAEACVVPAQSGPLLNVRTPAGGVANVPNVTSTYALHSSQHIVMGYTWFHLRPWTPKSFRWRVDTGDWHTVTSTPEDMDRIPVVEVDLGTFAAGPHTVTVEAVILTESDKQGPYGVDYFRID